MQRPSRPPAISVIIPVRDRAYTVSRAIHSVLRQRLGDFEVVVVDDGSTDDTVEAVRRIQSAKLRIVSQPHSGPGAARNTGAASAMADLLTFLDSDDEAEPTWLEEMYSQFQDSSVDVALCGYRYVERDGTSTINVPPLGRALRPDDVAPRFLAGCWLVKRELFLGCGGFDSAIQFGENSEMALRLFASRPDLVVRSVARPLVLLTRRENPLDLAEQIAGARAVLDRYALESRAFPETWASYHTILGADAARRGEYPLARRHFLEAFRSDCRGRRRALRLVGALLRPVARRAWPP